MTTRPREVATGDDIDVLDLMRITAVFAPLVHATRVYDDAGFYDSAEHCDQCDAPYCREHWHVIVSVAEPVPKAAPRAKLALGT